MAPLSSSVGFAAAVALCLAFFVLTNTVAAPPEPLRSDKLVSTKNWTNAWKHTEQLCEQSRSKNVSQGEGDADAQVPPEIGSGISERCLDIVAAID